MSCNESDLHPNLFGELKKAFDDPIHGHFKSWRNRHGYKHRGHSPTGDCCKRCVHLRSVEGHTKIYHKCALQGISNSEASDIRLNNVCDMFKKEPNRG